MVNGRALMTGRTLSLPELPPTPANRLWLGKFVDTTSSGGSDVGGGGGGHGGVNVDNVCR
jgi:hypothetical protein